MRAFIPIACKDCGLHMGYVEGTENSVGNSPILCAYCVSDYRYFEAAFLSANLMGPPPDTQYLPAVVYDRAFEQAAFERHCASCRLEDHVRELFQELTPFSGPGTWACYEKERTDE